MNHFHIKIKDHPSSKFQEVKTVRDRICIQEHYPEDIYGEDGRKIPVKSITATTSDVGTIGSDEDLSVVSSQGIGVSSQKSGLSNTIDGTGGKPKYRKNIRKSKKHNAKKSKSNKKSNRKSHNKSHKKSKSTRKK